MYHTILVPLDGSKRAESILSHVEELARRYDAKVILVQVVEPTPLVMDFERYKDDLKEKAQEAERYLACIKGEFREKRIDARTRVVHGPVVEAITMVAERENADLIAIASHGRSGLSRVFYGSTAAGILYRVDRPLLLIRTG